MKPAKLILRCVTIVLGLVVSGHDTWGSETGPTLKEQARLASARIAGRLPRGELDALLGDISGEDPSKAREAVKRFAAMGGREVVAVALKYPASTVQIEAAVHLKRIGSLAVLPQVVAALETANADLLVGGSEVVLANHELKSCLLDVIAAITKTDLRSVDVADTAEVQKVIRAAKERSQRKVKRR